MTPSELIDKRIKELSDWRGDLFSKLRKIIMSADPDIKEEWKWDTAVWTHSGMVCAVGVFKDHMKLNFFQGASINDAKKLFNAGFEAKKTRAIDFYENDEFNEGSLKELIKTAISFNKEK